MPVVLNKMLVAVTKMTAIKLPNRSGTVYQGKRLISFALHGSMKETCGGG